MVGTASVAAEVAALCNRQSKRVVAVVAATVARTPETGSQLQEGRSIALTKDCIVSQKSLTTKIKQTSAMANGGLVAIDDAADATDVLCPNFKI